MSARGSLGKEWQAMIKVARSFRRNLFHEKPSANELRDNSKKFKAPPSGHLRVFEPSELQASTGLLSVENVLDDNFIANRISPHRKHLWLVAAPKSGSTWLTSLLHSLLEWQWVAPVAGGDRREQEVDIRPMLVCPEQNVFSPQQHCRYSEFTRNFIQQFRVRVVLQGRNIFDTVVSFRDHIVQESPAFPMAYADHSFADLTTGAASWILLLISSYLGCLIFMLPGSEAKRRGEVEYYWVGYDALRQDTRGTLNDILAFADERRSAEQIDSAISHVTNVPTRLNVGVKAGSRRINSPPGGTLKELSATPRILSPHRLRSGLVSESLRLLKCPLRLWLLRFPRSIRQSRGNEPHYAEAISDSEMIFTSGIGMTNWPCHSLIYPTCRTISVVEVPR